MGTCCDWSALRFSRTSHVQAHTRLTRAHSPHLGHLWALLGRPSQLPLHSHMETPLPTRGEAADVPCGHVAPQLARPDLSHSDRGAKRNRRSWCRWEGTGLAGPGQRKDAGAAGPPGRWASLGDWPPCPLRPAKPPRSCEDRARAGGGAGPTSSGKDPRERNLAEAQLL